MLKFNFKYQEMSMMKQSLSVLLGAVASITLVSTSMAAVNSHEVKLVDPSSIAQPVEKNYDEYCCQ